MAKKLDRVGTALGATRQTSSKGLQPSVWLTAPMLFQLVVKNYTTEALRPRPSTKLRMRGYEEFRSW
jgi:hypothetical protein